jgi:hypothetical protein
LHETANALEELGEVMFGEAMFSYPTIRAICSVCNADVMLTIDEVHVYVQELGDDGSYVFTCPQCHIISSRLVPFPVAQALMSMGCLYTVGTISPLNLDEVIDFRYMLEDDDAVREAFANELD